MTSTKSLRSRVRRKLHARFWRPAALVRDSLSLIDIALMTVISLGLKGSYDYSTYQKNIERLREWLAQHPEYTVVGSPRRFFYDAPYVPEPAKRSEIQIPIRQVEG